MSRQHNLKLVGDERLAVQGRLDDLIADYLDHLCAPLVGIVPYPNRKGLREEAQSHIEALIAEYEYRGQSPTEATEAALREFGEPWQAGEAFLREWSQGAPDAGPARLTRQAAWRAFGWFGVFTVANLLLVEQYALGIGNGDYLLPAVILSALLSPIIAGVLTGASMPARVGQGTFWATGILALDTLATGLVMLPHLEGLKLALFEILLWLPAGCLSSTVTASLVRQRRRQHFRRLAR